jgi:hypothetical protein
MATIAACKFERFGMVASVKTDDKMLISRDAALRQLHEGAAPTIDRLAAAAGKSAVWLQRLADREGWQAMPEASAMQARLALMSRRIIALLDEPDDEVLLGKQRLDAISALLRAIDRLKSILDEMAPQEPLGTASEASMIDAFAAIDERIEQLAHAYAKKLVEEKTETGSGNGGNV